MTRRRACAAHADGFYNKCMGMSGCVMAWTGLLRVHFPSADAQTLFNLSRYMVASVYLLYFQLGGSASDGGKNVVESEWQVLIQTGLIGGDEADRLKAYKGFRPFLLQARSRCLSLPPSFPHTHARARALPSPHALVAVTTCPLPAVCGGSTRRDAAASAVTLGGPVWTAADCC